MRCFSEWRTIPDKQRKIYLARLGFEPATFGTSPMLYQLSYRSSWSLVRIPAGPSRFFSACPVWFVTRRNTSLLFSTQAHNNHLTVKCFTFMLRQRSEGSIAFFFKTFYGYSNINTHDYVTHGHMSLGENVLNYKTPLCKTSTFQTSYFNRVVNSAFDIDMPCTSILVRCSIISMPLYFVVSLFLM